MEKNHIQVMCSINAKSAAYLVQKQTKDGLRYPESQ